MRRARGFLVPSLYLALGAAAVSAVGASYVTRLYYLQDINQIKAEAQDAADAASEMDRLHAKAYEVAVAQQKVKTITVTRRIDRVIQDNRQWADGALPDSVRLAAEEAAVELGAAEPGGPVSAVRAASAPK